ncbi:hypothetical protein, partial [Corynebacterium amycolatum]|uniref:hypothetical protein n=1 Tax=Corynebacterium amycolatum TaxID=43765 RepID=UPI001C4D0D4F
NYPNPGRNAGHNHKPLEVSKTSMDSVSKKTPDSMSKNPMDITVLGQLLSSFEEALSGCG